MGSGEGHGKGIGCGRGQGKGRGWGSDRIACPAIPLPAAIICCIINFILPGIGTILAGCINCCCGLNEGLEKSEVVGACCASFGIGLAQLILTPFGLIGWIWSCVWGVFMIGQSVDYKNKIEQNPEEPGARSYGAGYGHASTNVVYYGGYSTGPRQTYHTPGGGSYPTNQAYPTAVIGQPYAPPPAAPGYLAPTTAPPSYTAATTATVPASQLGPSAPCPPSSENRCPDEPPPSYQR